MDLSVEGSKRRRVFQVAQELKVVTPTIIEFLEARGYDVSRKQMQPVNEEMYVELLRRFDQSRFQRYQADQIAARQDDKKRDTARLREAELEKIIAAKGTTPSTQQKKIELPIYREVVVEPAAGVEPESITEAAPKSATPAVESEHPSEKAARRKPLKADKRPKTPAGRLAPVGAKFNFAPTAIEEVAAGEPPAVVEGAGAAVAEVAAPKAPGKRKIELPEPRTLQVIEPASPTEKEEKSPPRKKLKRKRVKPKAETPEDALETEVESRLIKDKERQAKQKAAFRKLEVVTVGRSSRKRRRRRKSKAAAVAPGAVKSGRAKKRRKVDEVEVAATIKKTVSAMMSSHSHTRRRHVRTQTADNGDLHPALKVTEFLTTQELAALIEAPVQDIIRRGLEMGMIISINQRLDHDTIELLAAEFDVDVEFVLEEDLETIETVSPSENLQKRSPVVTVMGHVDHGKTTLLDHLRSTRVAEAEVGGITQHIGAYEVNYKGDWVTFLDTPGHEAFTAMRARGAQITDIVVLVVAADDRVMPQTLEAIDHARAAGVPIIIAVNKIDKPEADPEAIYKYLADNNILVEKWGGKYQAAEISAKFGTGMDNLLAEILVAAELLDLKADPTANARGVVVESQLDKGLGAIATILIQNGTLKIGEPFLIGQHYGRVRAMYNELGESREDAGPSTPVRVVGFNGVPQAGDRLLVYPSEREAREVSLRRLRQYREISMRQIRTLTLEQVSRKMKETDMKELPLIIKGDVHGSVEVLCDALMKLSTSEVQVQIIHRSVGGITESDILLAAASGAIVIGFHVHPNPQAREVARSEGVEIRVYRIIHEVVDDIRKSLEGLLAPESEERHTGILEVRQVFKISRIGTIAGCYVQDGRINRHSRVRLIRDDVEVWSGELASLKRFKDDAREVASGFECGIVLQGWGDLREGDTIEAYEVVELMRKLEDTV